MESTASLLARVRDGDASATDVLIRRYLPLLQRWARGRLPSRARDLADTDDLVQLTLLRALNRVKAFEARRPGAFLAYLRQVLRNAICDEIRRAERHPTKEALSENMATGGPSPLEQAIGSETLEAYEAALDVLPEQQQEALFMRLELGFTYREVAEALECPSPNAARMMVVRSLVVLVETMRGKMQ